MNHFYDFFFLIKTNRVQITQRKNIYTFVYLSLIKKNPNETQLQRGGRVPIKNLKDLVN